MAQKNKAPGMKVGSTNGKTSGAFISSWLKISSNFQPGFISDHWNRTVHYVNFMIWYIWPDCVNLKHDIHWMHEENVARSYLEVRVLLHMKFYSIKAHELGYFWWNKQQ